ASSQREAGFALCGELWREVDEPFEQSHEVLKGRRRCLRVLGQFVPAPNCHRVSPESLTQERVCLLCCHRSTLHGKGVHRSLRELRRVAGLRVTEVTLGGYVQSHRLAH